MKKIIISVLALLATISTAGCSNNQEELISIETAKELATHEIESLEVEEIENCELLDLGLEHKIYRVSCFDKEMSYVEIDIDAITGDIIQSENESLKCGKYDLPKEHLSKDEIKQIVFKEIPNIQDFNINKCYFDIDDDDVEQKPYYYVDLFDDKGAYKLQIDAINGTIIDKNFKEDVANKEDMQAFKEEFNEYLPERRFAQANGQKPIWLLAHHCNKNYVKNTSTLHPQEKRDVYKGLASGCNGVEIDLSHRKSDNSIILRHTPEIVGNAETLSRFLALPEMNDQRMTMVVYDIKDQEFITQMVKTTHNFYQNNPQNQKVRFIYSVDVLSKLKVGNDSYKRFRDIKDMLWPNEALEVDYENSADDIQKMFNELNFTRGVYGNGLFSGQARGNIEKGCKKAVTLKANTSNPYRIKAVESWTVGRYDNKNHLFYTSIGLRERVATWGCDIVLLDGFKSLKSSNYSSFYANKLFADYQDLRLANRSDNPF